MQRESPGKHQANALNSIFFSLPHKPIAAMSMSNKDLFDDDDDFSETEEESPAHDSDEMSAVSYTHLTLPTNREV